MTLRQTIPSTQTLPRAGFQVGVGFQVTPKLLISLVPGERFELPTNGLQIGESGFRSFKQKDNKNNQMLQKGASRGAFFMSQNVATSTIDFQSLSRSRGSSTRHETRHGRGPRASTRQLLEVGFNSTDVTRVTFWDVELVLFYLQTKEGRLAKGRVLTWDLRH
jgi:hypothetical protein